MRKDKTLILFKNLIRNWN